MRRTNFEANLVPEVNEIIKEQLRRLSKKQRPPKVEIDDPYKLRVCNVCREKLPVFEMTQVKYKTATIYKCNECIRKTDKKQGKK